MQKGQAGAGESELPWWWQTLETEQGFVGAIAAGHCEHLWVQDKHSLWGEF